MCLVSVIWYIHLVLPLFTASMPVRWQHADPGLVLSLSSEIHLTWGYLLKSAWQVKIVSSYSSL